MRLKLAALGLMAAPTACGVAQALGKPALAALRLKVERRMITEVEQLFDAAKAR